VGRLLDELTASADDVVLRAAPGAPLVRQRVVFMRYAGQGHEIPVELPEGAFDATASAALHQRFEARYAALYGRSLPHIAAEAVSWSVAVEAGGRAAPEADGLVADEGRATASATRELYDAETGRWQAVPVYERAALRPGLWIEGPALVVEDETTTQLIAGFQARVSRLGALVLDDTTAVRHEEEEHAAAVAA
jgi:N-methylhydantoinase A